MIKCAHCKSRHHSIADVRACAALGRVAAEHKIHVPFVGHSAYMAGEEHTVSCSCEWSLTRAGSENVLWAAAQKHCEEERAALV